MDVNSGIGDGSLTSASWDVNIRHNFVKKVYGILSVQLAFTAGMIALAVTNREAFLGFIIEYPFMVYVAFGATFVTLIAISCCENQARTTPNNYILLSIFTVFEAFLLGVITLRYDAGEVLSATATTAALVFALTLFAFQTKYGK
jgi:FtsH-binding integral membrane protein